MDRKNFLFPSSWYPVPLPSRRQPDGMGSRTPDQGMSRTISFSFKGRRPPCFHTRDAPPPSKESEKQVLHPELTTLTLVIYSSSSLSVKVVVDRVSVTSYVLKTFGILQPPRTGQEIPNPLLRPHSLSEPHFSKLGRGRDRHLVQFIYDSGSRGVKRNWSLDYKGTQLPKQKNQVVVKV